MLKGKLKGVDFNCEEIIGGGIMQMYSVGASIGFGHVCQQGKELRKAILVVSFGTNYSKVREKTIKACEDRLADKYSDYDIKRAFTSRLLIDIFNKRNGIKINNPKEALEILYYKGYQEVIVQPLHIININEYNILLKTVNDFSRRFKDLKIAKPLLTDKIDYFNILEVVQQELPELLKREAVVLLGQGIDYLSDYIYACLDYVFKNEGLDNYYIGTIEGYLGISQIIKRLKKNQVKKVYLAPLLLVAGNYIKKDISGDKENSWETTFKREGFEVEVYLSGMDKVEILQSAY